MAVVEIKNINKYFGSTQVLFNVDIMISDGEFVVLVGPSGCGKTTLLRMVAGLETVSKGEIVIGERMVNILRPKDRDVAMVFQNYALYPHMTTFDNMAFSLKLRKIDRKKIQKSVESVAKILGLTDLLNRYPKELSGGQRQRVAMGRSIVRKPKVFLFDEPLSNLDAKLRVLMRAEIKALHQKLQTTSIYVTHDQVEAMTMADRIVVMNEGRIIQIGKPLDVYDNPVNTFVAGFIGSPSMNFIEGTVLYKNGKVTVKIDKGILLPMPQDTRAQEGEKVIYGIRPDYLEIGDSENGFPAKVKVIQETGAEALVFCKIGNKEVCARLSGRPNFHYDEEIYLRPLLNSVKLFSPQTQSLL